MGSGRRRAAGTERDLFARVIAAWARDAQDRPRKRGGLHSLLDAFETQTPEAILGQIRHGPQEMNLATDQRTWILGAPVETGALPMFPIAAVSLREYDDRLAGQIKVALLQESRPGVPTVTGWRFESAEQVRLDGKMPPHVYPHAQPISGWHTDAGCLLHPHASGEDVSACPPYGVPRADQPALNESRPAFPLRGETLPGLAAAALATLYGAGRAREILDTDQSLQQCAQTIRADFDAVLGATPPPA